MASLVGSRGAAARVLRGTPGILSGLPPVAYLLTRNASSRAPITDKTRILEKPAKFNPPSHGSRRVRPRAYPGAPLSEQEREAQNEKRYPNMMPPEGSFSRWFLTNRTLHLWITLGVLTTMAGYSIALSFISTTAYRDMLPSSSDFFSHPLQSLGQFITVYKLHVAHESEKVAEKRRRKLEDVKKREEFMRAHGVEPGFLTGGWMDKFGTVEGDLAKKQRAEQNLAGQETDREIESPVAMQAVAAGPVQSGLSSPDLGVAAEQNQQQQQQQEKRKPKLWLGIW